MNDNMMMNGSKTKKTLGRRKIEMKKIEKKTNLSVTFSKRRTGLFKKARELSVLCGSDIAIIVQSPANKIYACGTPSVDTVLHRFHHSGDDHDLMSSSAFNSQPRGDEFMVRNKYDDALRKLEGEKTMIMGNNSMVMQNNWWEQSIDQGMGLKELEEYLEALERLKANVLGRVDQINNDKAKAVPLDQIVDDNAQSSLANSISTFLDTDDDHQVVDDLMDGLDDHMFDLAQLISNDHVDALAEKGIDADQGFEDFKLDDLDGQIQSISDDHVEALRERGFDADQGFEEFKLDDLDDQIQLINDDHVEALAETGCDVDQGLDDSKLDDIDGFDLTQFIDDLGFEDFNWVL